MTKTSVSVSCFRSLPLWKNIFSQFSDSIILSALANIYFYLKSGKTIILGTFISFKEIANQLHSYSMSKFYLIISNITSGQSFKASTLVNYDSSVVSIRQFTSNYDQSPNLRALNVYKIGNSPHFALLTSTQKCFSYRMLMVLR